MSQPKSQHVQAAKPKDRLQSAPPKQKPFWRSGGFLLVTGSVLAIAIIGSVANNFIGTKGLFSPARKAKQVEEEFSDPETDKKPLAVNEKKPIGSAPKGMVWIPGGEFWMGYFAKGKIADRRFAGDTDPPRRIWVDGFWMDETEVTNDAFAEFVKATGYKTTAEQDPDPKEFPNVDPSKLKPFSMIFKQPGPKDPVDLNQHLGWWDLGYGASWKHPEGATSTIEGKGNLPVVQISYDDAVAYCKWAGKRLPTEAEWEFAARGGLDRKPFAWGDEFAPGGKQMANTWQGEFPRENEALDGYNFAAPVKSYPPNGYGLYDMTGNVWEWCNDWYQPDAYLKLADKNPKGPESGFDPQEPGIPKRVQRGGSFMCAPNYCARYQLGSRGKGEHTSAGPHIGFRCVLDGK